MPLPKFNRKALVVALAPVLAAAPVAAHASGFALLEQNASGLGNAYAGQAAVADDPSTIYFNPAGMTYLQGRQTQIGVDLISPSAKFSNSGSVPSGSASVPGSLRPLGGNGGEAGSLAALPSGYLSWQLSPQWWAGIGLNAPFGQKTQYSNDWMGRFQGIKSDIQTYNINPSVAYKVNDNVSLGFGVNYQHIDAEFSSQLNYSIATFGAIAPVAGAVTAGTVAAGIPAANREGLVTLKGNDSAWGWNAGGLFKLGPDTRLGVAYRSVIKYRITGTAQFDSAPTIGAPFGAVNAGFAGGNIYADVKLPDSLAVSLTHQLNDRWLLMGSVAWTGWSTIQNLTFFRQGGNQLSSTPENFRDTYRIAIGGTYKVNDWWSLRTGVAYDQSPVRSDSLTPRLPDQDRTWVSLGAQWRMTPATTFDIGYAHLFAKDTTINQNAGSTALSGLLSGNYKVSIDLLGAQMVFKF